MRDVFQEAALKHLRLKNRLVRSATQDPFGAADGSVTAGQLELYRSISAGGTGMVISGHVCVSPEGRASQAQNCFYDDSFIPGQRAVASVLRENGSISVLQISHAGGSVAPWPGHDAGLIGPSDGVYVKGGGAVRAMDEEDMERVRRDFAEAARRAAAAGFDAVQLHLAHNYLLSEFLNPCVNRRTDSYGADAEGRFRFPGEVLSAVRGAVGPDYPVFVKINCNCEENDGDFAEDFMYYMRELDKFGLEGIEISGFDFTPLGRAGRRNYYLQRASQAAAAISTPVFAVGGIRTREDMRRALGAGMELVSVSRPFICEPDLCAKLAADEDYSPKCTSCSKCFYLYGREGRRCIFHPLPEQKS